jgi:hypothetical protein
MEKLLSRLNPWWTERYTIDAVPREKYLGEILSSIENNLVIF